MKQRKLDTLKGKIDDVSEKQALQKLEKIQADLSSIEQELNEVRTEIARIDLHHEQRKTMELQLKQSRSDFEAYRTIEEAIFPGSKTKPAGKLFAHIQKKQIQKSK